MADSHPDQQAVAGPLGKQVLSLERMSAECQILERALCPASVKIIAVQITGRYSPSLKQLSQKLIEDPVSEAIISKKINPGETIELTYSDGQISVKQK
ncbi:MAG: hypothetical protein II157_03825 [Bacteroidales bacterium]|nr:hypothetical protein [Bacteroidales bacterium]